MVAAAVGAAVAPTSAALVDAWYSRGIYGILQPIVTSISSLFPFALMDALIGAALLWIALRVWRIARAAGPERRRAIGRFALDAIAAVAAAYLLFLGLWGLNYRRLPVTTGLDFDAARVTQANVDALGTHAVAELNRLHASAHALLPGVPTLAAVRVRLAPAFADAQREIGAAHLATPGRPKRSIVSPFFRLAGVDGMVNPLGLEVLVNPDVLPIERPFVVAHEWGHLAGWAKESEASLLGWRDLPALGRPRALQRVARPLPAPGAGRDACRPRVNGGDAGAGPARRPVRDRRASGHGAARGRARQLADLRSLPQGQPRPRGCAQLRRGRPACRRVVGRPARSAEGHTLEPDHVP